MNEKILNMKKNYFQPRTSIINANLDLLMAQSKLDPNQGTQNVNPDDTEWNDPFGAKGIRYWNL
jgi:hypothetical protein